MGWQNLCILNEAVEKVSYYIVLRLFGQEGEMRTSRGRRPSKEEGGGGKDEVRCSECGTRLMSSKDHIQKEDSFVCASCYQRIVYGHRTVGMEVFD